MAKDNYISIKSIDKAILLTEFCNQSVACSERPLKMVTPLHLRIPMTVNIARKIISEKAQQIVKEINFKCSVLEEKQEDLLYESYL